MIYFKYNDNLTIIHSANFPKSRMGWHAYRHGDVVHCLRYRFSHEQPVVRGHRQG